MALTHVQTNKIYHNMRRENRNKIMLENMKGGDYELLVYTHNCLTNMQSAPLQSLDLEFSIDLNLIKWNVEQGYKQNKIVF